MTPTDSPAWSPEFPNRVGTFWFFGEIEFGSMGGHFSGAIKPEARLSLVDIRKAATSLMAVSEGRFVPTTPFNKDNHERGFLGVWCEAILPDTDNEVFEKICADQEV